MSVIKAQANKVLLLGLAIILMTDITLEINRRFCKRGSKIHAFNRDGLISRSIKWLWCNFGNDRFFVANSFGDCNLRSNIQCNPTSQSHAWRELKVDSFVIVPLSGC